VIQLAAPAPLVGCNRVILIQLHGGKAKNDTIDSHKIAGLLRGGLLPQAYVYPAAMRSTRDLLRRRLPLVRKRGQLLAHIQNTRAQYQLPELGRRLAYPANRAGISEHFPDPSVRKSIDVDLALLERYDDLITDLELTIGREAKQHDGDTFHRLRSVPGIGKVLALTILDEIQCSRWRSSARRSGEGSGQARRLTRATCNRARRDRAAHVRRRASQAVDREP
jgi:transposase